MREVRRFGFYSGRNQPPKSCRSEHTGSTQCQAHPVSGVRLYCCPQSLQTGEHSGCLAWVDGKYLNSKAVQRVFKKVHSNSKPAPKNVDRKRGKYHDNHDRDLHLWENCEPGKGNVNDSHNKYWVPSTNTVSICWFCSFQLSNQPLSYLADLAQWRSNYRAKPS